MASPAGAQTKPLSRAGNWQAFDGTVAGANASGAKPVCGISQATADDSYFGIKLVAGFNGFTVQIGRKAWQIASQRQAKIVLRFDSGKPWVRDAQVIRFNDGDAGLEFSLTRTEFDGFSGEFRAASQLRIELEGMPEWLLDLAGSNTIANTFQDCIRTLH